MALNWTGVVSKGILKLKLAFKKDVTIKERNKQLADYAKTFSGTGKYMILSTTHFADGSSMEARIGG